jgi:hypothetical protein
MVRRITEDVEDLQISGVGTALFNKQTHRAKNKGFSSYGTGRILTQFLALKDQ